LTSASKAEPTASAASAAVAGGLVREVLDVELVGVLLEQGEG
jgi:hypothetical protein